MSVQLAPRPDTSDAERLAELEQTIESGLGHYIAVGRALETIRTERLYLATHRTFREYLRDRWNLSHPRGFALCYSAQVADVLEAAGEHPEGAESALREFAPVLHQNGPEAAVDAFRRVADNGVLPAATKTRTKLVDAGLVDAPERDVADGMQKRIVWLERAVPQIAPHAKLAPLLDGYAARLRDVAARLDEIAENAAPPIVPPGEPCLRHGSRRDAAGTCKDCRRRDVPRGVRVGTAA